MMPEYYLFLFEPNFYHLANSNNWKNGKKSWCSKSNSASQGIFSFFLRYLKRNPQDSLRKSEHGYDRQVTELKKYYEGVIGDLQDKIEKMESTYSSRLDDVMEKGRSQNQGLAELEYYKDFTDMVKREFQLFSDKYFATHSKSFDMKQGSRR